MVGRVGIALSIGWGLVVGPASVSPAHAGDAHPEAVKLFKAGRELVKKGAWTEACPLFAQSLAFHRATTTLLNLAQCAEQSGSLLQAKALTEEARTLAPQSDPKVRDALFSLAKEQAARIEAKLPWLFVRIDNPPAGMSVLCDGVPIVINQPAPVDPGQHFIVATAKGFRRAQVVVTANPSQMTELAIPLESESSPRVGPVVTSPASIERPPSAVADAAPSDGAPTWAWVSGGTGLAMGAAAVFFVVDAARAKDRLEESCGTDQLCDPSNADAADDISRNHRSFGLGIGLGVGSLVALGVSAYGFLRATPPSTTSTVMVIEPQAGLGWVGLSASSKF